MLRKLMLEISERLWLRVVLAVGLLIVGLAPVGAPILSDSALRQALRPALVSTENASFDYRWLVQSDGTSRVQRSETGEQGGGWRDMGMIPETVAQLLPAAGEGKLLFARSASAIWRSGDGGATWAKSGFPSRPMSLAVARQAQGLLIAGSESLGLFRSIDDGVTWQPVGQSLLAGGAGSLGISAVTINPEDERVVYAAPGYWLGTSEVHFSPLGVYVSVDSGGTWFPMMATLANSGQAGSITGGYAQRAGQLVVIPGRPLAVSSIGADNVSAGQRFELPVTPEFVKKLDDPDRNVRAATARALGLSGYHSTVPALLAHLHDRDMYAGDQVAEALGRLGDPAAVPALHIALSDQDEAVRARAAYALGLLKAQETVPQLAGMLKNDGALAKSRAAEALGEIATPEAVAALVVPLADDMLTPARQSAMKGLELAGLPAVPSLTAALRDANPARRRNAAEMLGWIRADSAVAGLASALSDPDAGVRSSVAWSLGELGTLQARQALAQAAQTEQDESVRLSLRQAMSDASTRRDLTLTPSQALMVAVTQIPIGRWTFLGLLIALAAVLLIAGPRQLRLEGTRQRTA